MAKQIRLEFNSDGFREIRPGEAQGAVIAGMGGDLCLKILKQSPEVLAEMLG